MIFISIFSILLFLVVLIDIKDHRIPNLLSIIILGTGLTRNCMEMGTAGLLFSAQGFITGFVLFWIQYRINTMGPGDVKLFAAIGSWFGWMGTIQAFFWTAIIGLVIAVIYIAKEHRVREYLGKLHYAMFHFLFFKKFVTTFQQPGNPTSLRITYAIPIALGAIAYLMFGGLF